LGRGSDLEVDARSKSSHQTKDSNIRGLTLRLLEFLQCMRVASREIHYKT
jgi:hypothetical protein